MNRIESAFMALATGERRGRKVAKGYRIMLRDTRNGESTVYRREIPTKEGARRLASAERASVYPWQRLDVQEEPSPEGALIWVAAWYTPSGEQIADVSLHVSAEDLESAVRIEDEGADFNQGTWYRRDGRKLCTVIKRRVGIGTARASDD